MMAPGFPMHRPRRLSILRYGVSSLALIVALHAQDARASALAQLGGTASSTASSITVTSPAVNASGMASASARARANVSRVDQAVAVAQQLNAAARLSAAALASAVPNGMASGGLVPVKNPVAALDDPSGLNTWEGAGKPTPDADDPNRITIEQTQQRALLSWETFNVGKDTTLTFDQHKNADWIAVNRVVGQLNPATGLRDPSKAPAPSQIQGRIKADGTVVVINQNGVVFSGTAQVNLNNLMVSSLEIGRQARAAKDDSGNNLTQALTIKDRNDEYLGFGLLGVADQADPNAAAPFTFSAQYGPGLDLAGKPISVIDALEGAIRVEAGATLTANDGGSLQFYGPKIVNAGQLTAAEGQVILQGGRFITLQRSDGSATAISPNIRGLVASSNANGIASPAYVENDTSGLIQTPRGSISLGATGGQEGVIQNGVLTASTSVSRNGAISISGRNIRLASGSTMAITPDASTETIPLSSTTFKTSDIFIGASSVQLGKLVYGSSKIEIGADAMIYAPNANVTIGAPAGQSTLVQGSDPASRIFIDSGAIIDVSGIKDVRIDAARNSVQIDPVKGNELRDTPTYRDSFLNGATVYIDPRISGVRDDGVAWVGSPLIEAASYYQQTGVTAAELMTRGGNLVLGTEGASGTGTFAPDVIVKQGAVLDISGGWVTYAAGKVRSSRLVTAAGQVVDISQANPNETYIGLVSGFVAEQKRWGITDTYNNPLLNGDRLETEYTEGRDAGSLTIKSSSIALDGTVLANAFAGARQILGAQTGSASSGIYGDARKLQSSARQLPTGGYLNLQALSRNATVSNLNAGGADIEIASDTIAALDPALAYGESVSVDDAGNLVLAKRDVSSRLPADRRDTIRISAGILSEMGLGQLNLQTSGRVDFVSGGNLDLPAGGILTVISGRDIRFAGMVSAPSGRIAATTVQTDEGNIFTTADDLAGITAPGSFDITVTGLLSTRGRWVNDFTADGVRGTAFLNGGSIALTSAADVYNTPAGDHATDLSGSIRIDDGALLDVSGGGYIDRSGALKLSAKGGNVSLVNQTSYFQLTDFPGTDQTSDLRQPGFRVTTNPGFPPNPDRINAHVAIAPGSIRAHGFGGGGAFVLQAPGLSFGPSADPTVTALPLDFVSATGFASYTLTSYATELLANRFDNALGGYNAVLKTQTLTVDAGQTLALTQSLFPSVLSPDQREALLGLASDGNLYDVLAPQVPQSAWDRKAASLTLGGLLELHVAAGGRIEGDAGASLTLAKLWNEGTIRLIGGTITQQEILPRLYTAGSAGGAAIGVHSLDEVFTTQPDGTILQAAPNAQGLTDDAGLVLTNAQIAASRDHSRPIYQLGLLEASDGVRLADGSVTDLSGEVLLDPRAVARNGNSLHTGKLIAGGRLQTLAGVSEGSDLVVRSPFAFGVLAGIEASETMGLRPGRQLTAAMGATIDLSGVADQFDVLQLDASYATTPVWSDGGDLAIGAGGRINGANISARGGNPLAAGGTLTWMRPVLVADDAADGLSVQTVARAGFDSLVAQGSLASVGDVALALRRSFSVVSQPYDGARAANVYTPRISVSGLLEISAPNIVFSSIAQSIPDPSTGVTGDGVARFHAGNALDVRGAIAFDRSVADVTLDSLGDLRLIGALPIEFSLPNSVNVASSLSGQLVVNGDLTLRAAQVYPTTGSTFLVASLADSGTIRIERPTAITPAAPYSAGGSLTIAAANIEQAGVVRVPLGRLALGQSADLALGAGIVPATVDLRIANGSVTSVSASGLSIPYGVTTDTNEYYFAPTSADALTAPPAAQLSVSGSNVAMEAGATVDLSGGGDLYAYEFISGTGGSRDVLDRFNADEFSAVNGLQYPDGRQVYAILPGVRSGLAYYDPIYSGDYGPLYAAGSEGRRVYLGAGPGLDAGWYTLLPAKYALLPGGMRVVEISAKVAPGMGAVLRDGSLAVSGHYGVAGTDLTDSDERLFSVQSQSVLLRYSKIERTTATQKFSDLAAHDNRISPRLPIDAGRLIINAVHTARIDTVLSTAPALNGRGAEADISGAKFRILSALPADAPGDDAVLLTADSLSNLNVASLLVGGQRTDNSDGTTSLDLKAQSVSVENDAAHPLRAGEILLGVSGPESSMVLTDGATLHSVGQDGLLTGDYLVNGAGALLRVSQGAQRLVTRSDTAAGATLRVGAVDLSGVSILMESSGDFALSGAASIRSDALALGAGKVSFVADPADIAGLVISPSLQSSLSGVKQLTIRTPNAIDFDAGDYRFGDVLLDTPGLALREGSTVSITTGTLELTNSAIDGGPDSSGRAGILELTSARTRFGSGVLRTYGFGGGVTVSADNGMDYVGDAEFDVGTADLTMTAPSISDTALPLRPGGTAILPSLTLTSTGKIALRGKDAESLAALSPSAGVPGAGLAVQGAAISVDNISLRATAGDLNLVADGTITVGGNAVLGIPGYQKTLGDSADPTTEYAPGGWLTIKSVHGGIIIADSASLVLGGGQGQAGTLELSAANGGIAGLGRIEASAPGGAAAFIFNSGGAFDLGGFAATLAGQFGDGIDIRSRAGDLTLAAGQSLAAKTVKLTADGGPLDIGGRIDTSGVSGGDVGLYGAGGVILRGTAVIDAHADGYADDDDRVAHGGTVAIGTAGNGAITVESGAVLDVHARRATARLIPIVKNGVTYFTYVEADQGGKVMLRAPILENPAGDSVNITFAGDVTGAREISVEAFKRYDLATVAGDGRYVGVVINTVGQALLDVAASDTGKLNFLADNGDGTLVRFIQDFDISGSYSHLGGLAARPEFVARPGVELAYDGDIFLTSNWNLGAGTVDIAGAVAAGLMQASDLAAGKFQVVAGKEADLFQRFVNLTYRVGGRVDGAAPVISLLAGGDLTIENMLPAGSILTASTVVQGGTAVPVESFVLTGGNVALAGTNVPAGTILAPGSVLPVNFVLPAATVLSGGTVFGAGSVLPVGAELPAGTILGAGLTLPDGTVLAGAGDVLSAALVLPTGFILPAGTILPAGVAPGDGFVLPKGTTLPNGTILKDGFVFPAGSQLAANFIILSNMILPSGTVLQATTSLPSGTVIPAGTMVPAGAKVSGVGTLTADTVFATDKSLSSTLVLSKPMTWVNASGVKTVGNITLKGTTILGGNMALVRPSGTFDIRGAALLGGDATWLAYGAVNKDIVLPAAAQWVGNGSAIGAAIALQADSVWAGGALDKSLVLTRATSWKSAEALTGSLTLGGALTLATDTALASKLTLGSALTLSRDVTLRGDLALATGSTIRASTILKSDITVDPGVVLARDIALPNGGKISDGYFTFFSQTDKDYLTKVLGGGGVPVDPLGAVLFNAGTTYATVAQFNAHATYPNPTTLPRNVLQVQLIGQTNYSGAAGVAAALVAPYNELDNSPAALGNLSGNTGDPLGSAQLFPLLSGGKVVDSSSYRLVAGADLTSVDPLRTAVERDASVTVAGETSYSFSADGAGSYFTTNYKFNIPGASSAVSVADLTSALRAQSGNLLDDNSVVYLNFVSNVFNGELLNGSDVPVAAQHKTVEKYLSDLFDAYVNADPANPVPNAGRVDKKVALFQTDADGNLITVYDPVNMFYVPVPLLDASGNQIYDVRVNYVYLPLKNAAEFLASISSDIALRMNKGASNATPRYQLPGASNAFTDTTTAAVKNYVRTGVGGIEVGAAGDVNLRDQSIVYKTLQGTPATATNGLQTGGSAIYTAGHLAGTAPKTVIDALTGKSFTLNADGYLQSGDLLSSVDLGTGTGQFNYGATTPSLRGVQLSNPVYAEGGGDITILAGGDVNSLRDVWQEQTRRSFGANLRDGIGIGQDGQLWRVGQIGAVTNLRVNTQMFQEGIGTLGGGNIVVNAGGDVEDVSLVATTSVTTANVASGTVSGQALWTFGGGDITIRGQGNLTAGRIDAGRGTVSVDVRGGVSNAAPVVTNAGSDEVAASFGDNATRLRISAASAQIQAGRSIDLQGVSALAGGQSRANGLAFYSPHAGASLLANGAITVDNTLSDGLTVRSAANNNRILAIYPGSLAVVSMAGGVQFNTDPASAANAILMMPSATGQLKLFAGGSIAPVVITMEDGDPGLLPGAFSIYADDNTGVISGRGFGFAGFLPGTTDVARRNLHNANPTHAGDSVPIRIAAGGDLDHLILSLPKLARISAGGDILDMVYFGQNLAASDVSRIVAGRDITSTVRLAPPVTVSGVNDTINFGDPKAAVQGNLFVIGGPGSLFIEAGRDLGPFLNSAVTNGLANGSPPSGIGGQTYPGGILSVGNEWNPWLPAQGASLYVGFGIGKGADYNGLRDAYLDPANQADLNGDLFVQVSDALGNQTPDRTRPIYDPILVAWMQENFGDALAAAYGAGDVSYEQAYAVFKSLPELQQRQFLIDELYFNELKQTSVPDGPSFKQYSRGYRAVNILFPASYGYTDNQADGGAGAGAAETIETGNLDLRLAAIETLRDGGISILGPGGRILAGSTVRTSAQADRRTYDGGHLFEGYLESAVRLAGASYTTTGDYSALPASIQSIPTGNEGVLTLRGGHVYSFTDGSLLLNQSRLFTQNGGDIVLWSSNADLNAGQGPKTSANFPPIVVRIDSNGMSAVDTAGGVSGAGIAAFQPEDGRTAPDVFLIAPRGTVDAGDAGVRVSGNLFIAAARVANANNFKVGGVSVGVSAASSANVGPQAGANAAAAAAQKAAESTTDDRGESGVRISVSVMGYDSGAGGGSDCADGKGGKNCKKS